MKNLILFTLIVTLFFACKKKDNDASNTKEPQIDTVYTFHPIDPALKPYYAFTDGSYWIYKEYTDKTIDSLVLSNYMTTTSKTSTLVGTTCKIDEFEIVTYTLVSTTNKLYCQYCQNFNFKITGDQIEIGYFYSITLNPNNPLTKFKVSDFILKDTINFRDGRVFKNTNMISYSTWINNIPKKSGDYVHVSDSYWLPNYGMIKCDEQTWKWELIRSKISLR